MKSLLQLPARRQGQEAGGRPERETNGAKGANRRRSSKDLTYSGTLPAMFVEGGRQFYNQVLH